MRPHIKEQNNNINIELKTSVRPAYRIRALDRLLLNFHRIPVFDNILQIPYKIKKAFCRKMPVIEGYEAWFNLTYKCRNTNLKEKYPILYIKPVIVEPHGIEGGIDRWAYRPWFLQNSLTMKFYPSISGYIELRVYFKDLKDSDTLIDDYGRAQLFRGNIGPDKAIRYYYKPFRVYSLYEVLMIIFTGSVTIFTILLFIITVLFFLNRR